MVNVNDDVTIGELYLGKTDLRAEPIMVEFLKRNVELHDASTATIMVSIRPSHGLWATKQRTKEVSVQVVKHEHIA